MFPLVGFGKCVSGFKIRTSRVHRLQWLRKVHRLQWLHRVHRFRSFVGFTSFFWLRRDPRLQWLLGFTGFVGFIGFMGFMVAKRSLMHYMTPAFHYHTFN